jgi:predicted signal transduction protein with EAL and GGDEF domain
LLSNDAQHLSSGATLSLLKALYDAHWKLKWDIEPSDPQSAATIRAIVNFAHDIGIVVIDQGVETEQHQDLLSSTDTMTQAQGFHSKYFSLQMVERLR